jgi:hypothetical protein
MNIVSLPKKDGRGGKRPGAGRKPTIKKLDAAAVAFVHQLMNDETADPKLRLEAAKTLLRYSPPADADGTKEAGGKWAELLK